MPQFVKFWILFVMGVVPFFAKAQWSDSFDYAQWSGNSIWKGDTGYYTTESGQLRSNSDSINHEFYLSRNFELSPNSEWEWWMNLKFNTSSVNYTDVYLFSDSSNLIKGRTGYFVRIGNTKDEICLYKTKAGGTPVLLIDGRDNLTSGSNNIVKILVVRNDTGQFQLFTDIGASGIYFYEGKATDTMLTEAKCFGISVRQSTASFHRKHFFDDIYAGPLRKDTLPPELNSWIVENDTQIELNFSEKVFLDSTNDIHFDLLGEGNFIRDLAISQGKNLTLTFDKGFTQLKNYELKLSGIKDSAGNQMKDTILKFRFVMPVAPIPGNILITEIMADPDPVVRLPNLEYIEIVNRHFLPLRLKGCTFSDPTKTIVIPDIIVESGEWVILCDNNHLDSFKTFGKAIGLSGMPALNNAGDELWIRDNSGLILDHVSYSDKWHKDKMKKDGGWSLELIDTAGLACLGAYNWISSRDFSGGTPGKPNSVLAPNPDLKAPELAGFEIRDETSLTLQFDEWLDSVGVFNSLNYEFTELVLDHINDYDQNLYMVTLIFKNPFPRGKALSVGISGLTDCSGNVFAPDTIRFLLPELVESGDIALNEILFNPKDDGVDYIELYNRSKKILDLSELRLANRSVGGELSNIKTVRDTTTLFYPETYLLLTSNIERVADQYPVKDKSVFLQMGFLPTMSNEDGSILLLDDSLKTLDSLFYEEKMHFELLSDFEGVSLERIDFNRPSNQKDNWMSAASSVGYGTPGLKNSQFRSEPSGTDKVVLDPQVFSPDGDGYNDLLMVKLNTTEVGTTVNLSVYDIRGRLVKQLANNELTASESVYVWDGVNENGEKALVGVYVLYIETFDLKGHTEQIKKAFSLAGKIDK